MGASKRPGVPQSIGPRLSSLASGLAGVPPAVIFGVVFFVGIVTSVVYGWRHWGRTVVARPIYRIAAESIQLTPPPPWVRTDLRAEVVRDGALDDLTIFDKDATIRVYQAFELHPWVAKVKRVSKHPPARLVVDLEYRRPVAWMEVPGSKSTDEGGVIPIDGSGYVLPSRDFTKSDLPDYLRISIRDARPYGLAGTAWGDARVAGAAKIAQSLREVWRPLQLYRIQLTSDPNPELARIQGEPIYELETAAHRYIVWGSPPGAERPNEPAASVKLGRLMQLAEKLGSLDQLPTTGADLRDLGSLPASHTAAPHTAAPHTAARLDR